MKSVSPFYHVVMCTLGAIFRFYYQFLSKYFFSPLSWHLALWFRFYSPPFMDCCWLTTPPSQSVFRELPISEGGPPLASGKGMNIGPHSVCLNIYRPSNTLFNKICSILDKHTFIKTKKTIFQFRIIKFQRRPVLGPSKLVSTSGSIVYWKTSSGLPPWA